MSPVLYKKGSSVSRTPNTCHCGWLRPCLFGYSPLLVQGVYQIKLISSSPSSLKAFSYPLIFNFFPACDHCLDVGSHCMTRCCQINMSNQEYQDHKGSNHMEERHPFKT